MAGQSFLQPEVSHRGRNSSLRKHHQAPPFEEGVSAHLITRPATKLTGTDTTTQTKIRVSQSNGTSGKSNMSLPRSNLPRLTTSMAEASTDKLS